MAAENYYEVLGLKPGANDEDVKQAFRELAKVLHPDRNPGDAEAERRFKLVNTAYEALKDASRRRAYDEWLAFARKHERSRLAQWGRLAAVLCVLLLGPSMALYWALVFLDIAGPSKEGAKISTAVEAPHLRPESTARPNTAARTETGPKTETPPKTEVAKLPNPQPVAPPRTSPPAQKPAGESVAVLAAPPVTEPSATPDATASIAPRKKADAETEEPASPPDSRPKGPSRDREEPGAPRDTRPPGVSEEPRDTRPSRPSRDREDLNAPGSLRSITGANESDVGGNTPSRASDYLPPASSPPAQAPQLAPGGEGPSPARSMARMIAELKEAGALPQDDRTRNDGGQRQAALPDDQRRPPAQAGEPEDFSDCDRCPVMSIVEATDIAPTPGARRPLPTRTLAISKTEVTVLEWNACVEDGACRGFREYGASTHKPILDVTRSEAMDYASWLSRKTGKIYRPMKTGGWQRPNVYGADGDCAATDPQSWMDEDCDPRARGRGNRPPGGAGGFRVARTLGPDG